MLTALSRYFTKRKITKEVSAESPDTTLLNEVDRLVKLIDPVILSLTPAAHRRAVKFNALHNDIYHLLWAIKNSSTSARFLEKPDMEVTKSRKLPENLKAVDLDNYLVDADGYRGDPYVIFNELKQETQKLVNVVKRLEGKDESNFDFYSRMNTNLFEELIDIIKMYVEASNTK